MSNFLWGCVLAVAIGAIIGILIGGIHYLIIFRMFEREDKKREDKKSEHLR